MFAYYSFLCFWWTWIKLAYFISTIYCVDSVYIQDTEYIIQFVINMLFYGTPILYPAELFPEAIRWVLYLNPFTHIVSAYRDFFMYHTLPAMSSVLYMVVMAIICFVLGMFIFRKLEKGFAEEI